MKTPSSEVFVLFSVKLYKNGYCFKSIFKKDRFYARGTRSGNWIYVRVKNDENSSKTKGWNYKQNNHPPDHENTLFLAF